MCTPLTRMAWFGTLLATFGLIADLAACSRSLPFPDSDPPTTDPVVPARSGYCSPQPVTHASDVAPDLYAWILSAEKSPCHLDRRTSTGADGGFWPAVETFSIPGTQSCEETGCWTALPAFTRAWTHVAAPVVSLVPTDSPNELWTGTVQAERDQATGEIRATVRAMQYGSSAIWRFDRRFDMSGHLLMERQYFDEALWYTTTNAWDGDHLIASRFVDTVNRGGEIDYTWSYVGDRMVRATATYKESGRVGAADFTYDADGRLTAVRRTVDGQLWSSQAWSYREGSLVRSSTEFVPALYESVIPLRGLEGVRFRGADTSEPLIVAATQPDWVASHPQPAEAGSCTPLPHAFSYGYPEADGVYALGWPVGDRPSGIDGDYGFGSAFDSGVDRWFGHDRVEGIAWNVRWMAPSLRVDIDYDGRGRMVVETLAASDGSVHAVRSRSYDGERLATDTRVLEREDEQLTTELVFTYDDAGKLVARTYSMNGVLVARHTWSYAGSEIARHTIAQQPIEKDQQPSIIPPNLASLPDELPSPVVHERSFSAGGQEIAIRRDGVLLESRTRDSAGRILVRSQQGAIDRYAYANSGSLLSYASVWNGDSNPDLALSYEIAPDSRLLARHYSYPENRLYADVFSYVCQ